MKIGVVGTGNVGRSLGTLLVGAGHDVRFGSRGHEAELPGPTDTVARAAASADLIVCATPYGIWPDLARTLAPYVAGKVVIDTANPYPQRDGSFAQAAIDAGQGAGVPVAELLPEAKLVRAFNSVPWPKTMAEAGEAGERIAIPIAGDDVDAKAVVAGLIEDIGFQPVDAGPLAVARAFDPGSPAYGNAMSAASLRRALGLELKA